MGYRVLDPYPRRPHIEFFRHHPNPFYSTSFELDATELRARARELGVSTYASLIWAFHRALLGIDAFRTRLVDDEIVLFDSLTVGMTVPAPGRTFTFATLDWQADATRFLAAAGRAMADASARIDLSPGSAPDFAYYTSLPRLPFTSFAHLPHTDPTAGQPNIAFGRFTQNESRLMVPIGLTVNHFYVDGADLGELYEATVESFAEAF
jgi:chloramphenicol O-acetyltransferase type A